MSLLSLRRPIGLSAVLLTALTVLTRLARAADPDSKPVDLLKLVNPRQHVVKGRWLAVRRTLLTDASRHCILQVPYLPLEEYDLSFDAERLRDVNDLQIALPIGRNQPTLVLDGRGGKVSGVSTLDGKGADGNETTHRGRVFPDTGAVTIVCRVRKDGLKVTADGKTVIDWTGDVSRFAHPRDWELPNKRAIGLGRFEACFSFSRIELMPVTGKGELLK